MHTGQFAAPHAHGKVRRLPVFEFTAAKANPPNRPVRLNLANHVIHQAQIRERTQTRIGFLDDLDIDIEDLVRSSGEKSAERAIPVKQNAGHFQIKSGGGGGLPVLPNLVRREKPVRSDQFHDDFRAVLTNGISPPIRWNCRPMLVIQPLDSHPGISAGGFERPFRPYALESLGLKNDDPRMSFRQEVGEMDGLQPRFTRCRHNALNQARQRVGSHQTGLAGKLEPPEVAFRPPGGGGNKPGNWMGLLGDEKV